MEVFGGVERTVFMVERSPERYEGDKVMVKGNGGEVKERGRLV